MEFFKQIKTKIGNNEIKQLISNYFEEYSFKKTEENDSKMVFTNGNLLKNMVTFYPLNWKSETTIDIQDFKVSLNCKVNSTFQAITKQENYIWESFIKDLEQTIIKGELQFETTKQAKVKNKSSITKYLGWAILGGVALGIPSGFIAYRTGIDSIASVGAATGALSFLYWRISKERENENGS